MLFAFIMHSCNFDNKTQQAKEGIISESRTRKILISTEVAINSKGYVRFLVRSGGQEVSQNLKMNERYKNWLSGNQYSAQKSTRIYLLYIL